MDQGLEPITQFSGKYMFLSNFYRRAFWYQSYWGRTAEHHFQAAKALDPDLRRWIYEADTPGMAKRRGRAIPRRDDWEEVKIGIMRGVLRAKFVDPVFQGQLIRTGTRLLIEGNTWGDTFWGCVRKDTDFQQGWFGENHLGKLLMQIRAELLPSTLPSTD